MKQKSSQYLAQANQAQAVKDKVTDNGQGSGDDPATSEKPTKKSGGGGGMGINPMSLLPLVTALMQNQNQQQPTAAAQTPQIQPCQPSSSNGAIVCGPPTQAATGPVNDSWNKGGGTSGMQSASADQGGFNPASIKDNSIGTNPNAAGDPTAAKPGKANVIANGGGQMPGGQGGTQPASLGGGGTGAGGGVGVHGSVADIDHGFQGRSPYAAQVQAMDASASGGGGGWSGYGRGGGDTLNGFPLADFLPGGKHAAPVLRGLAGGNARNIQIQSKDVNIWNRISAHMIDRCNRGLLRDCIP